MKILSIETSCDETAVSIIEASGNAESPSFVILGNALYSQISTHAEYGGVFPMLAKREHAKNIVPLFVAASKKAIETAISLAIHHTQATYTLDQETKDKICTILQKENDLSSILIDALEKNLEEDGGDLIDVDCIAVTTGPGLEPALWVGISFAKALAYVLKKPLIPINHMEGHIVSVLMAGSSVESNGMASETSTAPSPATSATEDASRNAHQTNEPAADFEPQAISPRVEFPALALLISGGHTELVLANEWHSYKVIGQTVDDAIGEAFDKVARLLNLPYPGGPKISKLAAESRAQNLREKLIAESADKNTPPWTLPRPMIKSGDYNFSFSGIKTAVLYALRKKTNDAMSDLKSSTEKLSHEEQATLCEEFENAVTEVLVSKTERALSETKAKTLIIGGGVIANSYIRSNFEKMIADEFGPESGQPVRPFVPSLDLSTDNSVMIGIAGYLRWISSDDNEKIKMQDHASNIGDIKASGNLSL